MKEEYKPENQDRLRESYYRSLGETELYQAYRSGNDPFATYYFIRHLFAAGDNGMAVQEMERLSQELDRRYSDGTADGALMALLTQVKLDCGSCYENGEGGAPDLSAAETCYAQALELGSREGAAGLLRCYEKAGTLKARENEVLTLLRRLEDGDVAEKCAAAKLYSSLGRTTFAKLNYEAVLKDESADSSLRAEAMVWLYSYGYIPWNDLLVRSQGGDACASFAAGCGFLEDDALDMAEESFRLSIAQDAALEGKATEKLNEIQARREREQAEKEKADRMAEERHRWVEAQREEERRQNSAWNALRRWFVKLCQEHPAGSLSLLAIAATLMETAVVRVNQTTYQLLFIALHIAIVVLMFIWRRIRINYTGRSIHIIAKIVLVIATLYCVELLFVAIFMHLNNTLHLLPM